MPQGKLDLRKLSEKKAYRTPIALMVKRVGCGFLDPALNNQSEQAIRKNSSK